jgi:hypothetical protein
MNARRSRLSMTVLLGACLVSPVAAAGEEGDGAEAFARAMQVYAHDHYAQAFAELALLADRGHTEAARIVWLMHRHGPRLYGLRFAVEAGRGERWLSVASAGHDDVLRSARR